jgi:major membrane immunogen (membrane-anchored lipoprotein)
MLNEIVDFRFSDSDLAAYLLMQKYEPTYIEVKVDRRHNNRLKAFIHFTGERGKLINIQRAYRDKTVEINLKDFSIARQQINKIVKNALAEFQERLKDINEE